MDTKVKVAVLVTDRGGRVLLIKEKLGNSPTALWNVIKGSYNGGETIFEAAVRECKEEASVEAVLTHSLGTYVSELGDKIRIQFNFLATTSDDPHIASAEDQLHLYESIEETRWFSENELARMVPEEFISFRAYQLLHDWMKGSRYPLESVKEVNM